MTDHNYLKYIAIMVTLMWMLVFTVFVGAVFKK